MDSILCVYLLKCFWLYGIRFSNFFYSPLLKKPPTRDDWISGIRGAVDNCSPGSDSEGGLGYGAISSSEEVLRRKTESKHLRQRRLIAELRSKDIELAKLLEDKMNIMKEMLQVVASGPDHDQVPEQHNINDSFVAADRLPSLDLPQPDYVSMVGSLVLRMRKSFLCIQLRIYSMS